MAKTANKEGIVSTDVMDRYAKNFVKINDLNSQPRIRLQLCPSVDISLGGGLVDSQLVEIAGPPKVGKTTTAVMYGKDALAKGMPFDYYDVESRITKSLLCNQCGLLADQSDAMTVIQSHPDQMLWGEDYLDILTDRILNTRGRYIVLDSIGGLTFSEQRDKTNNQPGIKAKKLSQFIHAVSTAIAVNRHIVVCLNHLKQAIKISQYQSGPSEYTDGGVALQYQCSTIIRMKPAGNIKEGNSDEGYGQPLGHKVKFEIKTSPTSQPAILDLKLKYGRGIDIDDDVMNTAMLFGLIKKSGSWYDYDGVRSQGVDKVIAAIREAGRYDELLKSIYSMAGM